MSSEGEKSAPTTTTTAVAPGGGKGGGGGGGLRYVVAQHVTCSIPSGGVAEPLGRFSFSHSSFYIDPTKAATCVVIGGFFGLHNFYTQRFYTDSSTSSSSGHSSLSSSDSSRRFSTWHRTSAHISTIATTATCLKPLPAASLPWSPPASPSRSAIGGSRQADHHWKDSPSTNGGEPPAVAASPSTTSPVSTGVDSTTAAGMVPSVPISVPVLGAADCTSSLAVSPPAVVAEAVADVEGDAGMGLAASSSPIGIWDCIDTASFTVGTSQVGGVWTQIHMRCEVRWQLVGNNCECGCGVRVGMIYGCRL